MAKKTVGVNFLHNHPYKEKELGLDESHVIVDRADWEWVVQYFTLNPDAAPISHKQQQLEIPYPKPIVEKPDWDSLKGFEQKDAREVFKNNTKI